MSGGGAGGGPAPPAPPRLGVMSSARDLTPRTPLIAGARVDEEGGARTLHADLCGDLTVVNAPELLGGLRDLLREADAAHARLSFADVGYVDSGALGALIEVRKTVGKDGGGVTLERMTKELTGLIRIMKLDALFEIPDAEPAPAPAADAGEASA